MGVEADGGDLLRISLGTRLGCLLRVLSSMGSAKGILGGCEVFHTAYFLKKKGRRGRVCIMDGDGSFEVWQHSWARMPRTYVRSSKSYLDFLNRNTI